MGQWFTSEKYSSWKPVSVNPAKSNHLSSIIAVTEIPFKEETKSLRQLAGKEDKN